MMNSAGIVIILTGFFWFFFSMQRDMVNPTDYRGFMHPPTDFGKYLERKGTPTQGRGTLDNIETSMQKIRSEDAHYEPPKDRHQQVKPLEEDDEDKDLI